MKWMTQFVAVLLITMSVTAHAEESSAPSAAEVEAIEQLASEIEGALVYTRAGRVMKVTIGQWEPVDLGPGTFARWSPDGEHIAVYHSGNISVIRADGSDRRNVGRGDHTTCTPIEFHGDSRRVIYWKSNNTYRFVDIVSRETHRIDVDGFGPLPGPFTGEPGVSADGKRMVSRGGDGGGPLYAVDLEEGTMRQYARGCSPGISPDGQWIMNNVGSHRELEIRRWDGSDRFTIDTRTAQPDTKWDDHHWSNHNDYITAQGEGAREDAYVVSVSRNRVTRVTFDGRVRAPDLFVRRDKSADAAASH